MFEQRALVSSVIQQTNMAKWPLNDSWLSTSSMKYPSGEILQVSLAMENSAAILCKAWLGHDGRPEAQQMDE
jgi:hypothetical protein